MIVFCRICGFVIVDLVGLFPFMDSGALVRAGCGCGVAGRRVARRVCSPPTSCSLSGTCLMLSGL